MTNIPMAEQEAALTQGSTVKAMTNIIGAALSLALVVGGVVWGYRTLVRDVSGVPVVRAVQGPMRVQPDDPGGVRMAHQGLAVNDVAATGSAQLPADRLILAPEPVDIGADDDVTLDTLNPQLLSADAQSDLAVEPLLKEPQDIIKAPEPLGREDVATADTLAEQIIANAELLDTLETTTESVDEKPKVGLQRSLRPALRPAKLGRAVQLASLQSATNAAVAQAYFQDIDPTRIPVGTPLVQLGAFSTDKIARVQWDRLFIRFDTYLDGKNRVIEKVTNSGSAFYRLRAIGFTDLNDARRLCSALRAEGVECVPVLTR